MIVMSKLIPLSKGVFAEVDDEDYLELSKHKWHLHKDGYAVRNVRLGVNKRTAQLMHRVVMGTEKGMEVDHIDGNKVNNQKSNLRNCNHKQNMGNIKKRNINGLSIYKGVAPINGSKKWACQILNEGKSIYLGTFETEKDAAYAYNQWAIVAFGEFANINDLGGYVGKGKCPDKNVRKSEHKYINWNSVNNVWRVRFRNKHYGTFHNLNDAIKKRNQILESTLI